MKEANHGPPIPSLPSPKGPPPQQTPPSVSHPKPPSPNESLLLKGKWFVFPRWLPDSYLK